VKVLVLLGNYRRYLACKVFQTDEELDAFIDKIVPLMMANVHATEPLKKRLEIVKDDYFVYAGAVTDFEVVELEAKPS